MDCRKKFCLTRSTQSKHTIRNNNKKNVSRNPTKFKISYSFLQKNETSPRLEWKYAVKIYLENVQVNNLQNFTISRLPKQPLRSRFIRKFFIQANTIFIKDKKPQLKTIKQKTYRTIFYSP